MSNEGLNIRSNEGMATESISDIELEKETRKAAEMADMNQDRASHEAEQRILTRHDLGDEHIQAGFNIGDISEHHMKQIAQEDIADFNQINPSENQRAALEINQFMEVSESYLMEFDAGTASRIKEIASIKVMEEKSVNLTTTEFTEIARQNPEHFTSTEPQDLGAKTELMNASVPENILTSTTAPEIVAQAAPPVITNNLNLSAIALTGEQQKRVDLLNEYEDRTQEPREMRNAEIDGHDAAWRERWLGLQGEIEQARATRGEQLLKDGTPAEHHAAILAKETADLIERFDIEKDVAAHNLDEGLPKPEKWVDFLKEKASQNPGDVTLSSLIEEAEKSPDAGLEGFGGVPIKAVTLSDLVHSIDKDGVLNYKRGLSTVIRDTGSRLDVKRLDNRDIEAALKISAQKFDMSKGLMLTGDAAFKVRAAEIAGKLGLPLQNSEPEVLMAWKRGHDKNPEMSRAVTPSVERGITGDLAVPKPLMELNGAVQLRADQRTIEHAEELSVVPNGDGVINLPSERLLVANAIIRETPIDALRHLAHADISKPDGGLGEEAKAVLEKEGLIDANGNLKQGAKDAIIVRDDKVLVKRESIDPHLLEANPSVYRTSGEHVREVESLQEIGQSQQAKQQYEADQKSLRTRNVDEALEKADERKDEHTEVIQHEVAAEEREIQIEAKAHQRPSRTRSRSDDMGMGA